MLYPFRILRVQLNHQQSCACEHACVIQTISACSTGLGALHTLGFAQCGCIPNCMHPRNPVVRHHQALLELLAPLSGGMTALQWLQGCLLTELCVCCEPLLHGISNLVKPCLTCRFRFLVGRQHCSGCKARRQLMLSAVCSLKCTFHQGSLRHLPPQALKQHRQHLQALEL